MHSPRSTPRAKRWFLRGALFLVLLLGTLLFSVLFLGRREAATEIARAAPAGSLRATSAMTIHVPIVANQRAAVATLLRQTGTEIVPLEGAILSETTPTVVIRLLPGVTDVRVTQQQGDDEPVDVSGHFPDLEATGAATATLTLPPGDVRLQVTATRSDGSQGETTAGLVLLDATDNVMSERVFEPRIDGNLSLPHESNTVLLLFPQGATPTDMADVLIDHALRPLDVNLPLGLVRAEIPDSRSPYAVTQVLRGDDRLDAAGPNFALYPETALGERQPQRLTDSYQTSAGSGCSGSGQIEGCFDYSGDLTDELAIFRYHFFLDSFAAHRLVEHLVPAASLSTTLSIIDTGFTIAGPDPLDVPQADFVNVTQLPTAFDTGGVPIQADGTPQNFTLADVADASGHGTAVTAAAAGRGRTTLGTGPHVLVRPVRRVTAPGAAGFISPDGWVPFYFNNVGTALDALARDPDVVAINGSFGTGSLNIFEPFWDNNGSGAFSYTDTNGNGQHDAGEPSEPFLDLSGDGRWTGRDGQIQAWERTYVRNNVVPVVRPIFQRAFHRLMNPYLDRNGNGQYDAGEPFADTNGNGVYDAAADGKIYVASGGNDGVSYGMEVYPKRLAPSNVRTANDYLLMTVSNAQTQDDARGPEELRHSSNFGAETSVAAPGGRVPLPDHNGNLFRVNSAGNQYLPSGTSFSAPMVTGLAGEMIYLDHHANAAGTRLSPLQIIEMIEATADDLGTAENRNQQTRPNDRPGDGVEQYFGHGRINVWKAMLAVVNRGVATESHPNLAADFASLTAIDEGNTQWYGFKIHAPLRGVTVWIDGVQVTDGGSTAPGGINAYAGVSTDRIIRVGIGDEDPTTGVAPIGSQSDFLVTFSIERGDLVKADGVPVLQLRRPGETADDAPFFNLRLDLQAMRDNEIPGVIFDDFVFEVTPPDFGDAGASPTTLADDGPRHVHNLLEYFGRANASSPLLAVSPEHKVFGDVSDVDGIGNWGTDLEDLDGYDDGITFYPLTYEPGEEGRIDVQVCVDEAGPRYDRNDPDRQLYVNGWVDWNTNGAFEEGNEHMLDGLRLAPVISQTATMTNPAVVDWRPLNAPAGVNVTLLHDNEDCAEYSVTFTTPALGTGKLQSRWRLDYGEDVGRHNNGGFPHLSGLDLAKGAARYGEVEDYVIGSDFGDAGPDGPWDTTLGSNGPRHLNIYREWVGGYGSGDPSASRETDACQTYGADQDGGENLGNTCGEKNQDGLDDVVVSIVQPNLIQVDFSVSSTVEGYGFDGNNGGASTLKSDCTLGSIASTPETPDHQQVHMRYDANNPAERLYVNIWFDSDGDGTFERELLSAPVDPEDFGADGAYTLGEAFTDQNNDGVWNPGEPFQDAAGVTTRTVSCRFGVPTPPPPDVTQWLRLRLDYGENVGQYNVGGVQHDETGSRQLSRDHGGAVWGEVEDAPLNGPDVPTKVSRPTTVVPGDAIRYTVYAPANADLSTISEAFVEDELPAQVQFQEGSLECTFAQCDYNPSGHTVVASGSIEPGQLHYVTFEVLVPPEIPPTDCPPTVTNRGRVYDGITLVDVETTTELICE